VNDAQEVDEEATKQNGAKATKGAET
jgi:hypothetical protein